MPESKKEQAKFTQNRPFGIEISKFNKPGPNKHSRSLESEASGNRMYDGTQNTKHKNDDQQSKK